MRTRRYGEAEAKISAADTTGIRERWLYGLRLIHDDDAIAAAGGLRHGVTEQLIEAARRRGIKISEREIRYRMQCARAYSKESQIRHAGADFEDWTALRNAGFPAYEAPAGEPDADWRTESEKRHDAARDLLPGPDGSVQAELFADFEFDAPLKELRAYAEEQAAITARFVARDAERAEYLAALFEAVGGDESVSWREAHRAAFAGDVEDGTAETDDADLEGGGES